MIDRDDSTILAIDCASEKLQLGLQYGGDRLVKSSEKADRSQGQIIIRKIQNLLESANVSIDHLDGIVVCRGPGSFTGLRIGLSTAKGIATALGIPVAGISLFDIAAYRLKSRTGRVMLLTPFLRDEYFMTIIEHGIVDDEEVTTVRKSDLRGMNRGRKFAAIGFASEETVPQLAEGSPAELINYDSTELLYLGIEKLCSDCPDDLVDLEPLYLRKSQAEIRHDERSSKNG